MDWIRILGLLHDPEHVTQLVHTLDEVSSAKNTGSGVWIPALPAAGPPIFLTYEMASEESWKLFMESAQQWANIQVLKCQLTALQLSLVSAFPLLQHRASVPTHSITETLFTTISTLLIAYSFRARTLDFFAFPKTPGGCLAPKYGYLHGCLQIAYKLRVNFIDSRLVLTLIRDILGFTISQVFCKRLRYKVFTKRVPLVSYYSFWNHPIGDNHGYQLLCSRCPFCSCESWQKQQVWVYQLLFLLPRLSAPPWPSGEPAEQTFAKLSSNSLVCSSSPPSQNTIYP